MSGRNRIYRSTAQKRRLPNVHVFFHKMQKKPQFLQTSIIIIIIIIFDRTLTLEFYSTPLYGWNSVVSEWDGHRSGMWTMVWLQERGGEAGWGGSAWGRLKATAVPHCFHHVFSSSVERRGGNGRDRDSIWGRLTHPQVAEKLSLLVSVHMKHC